MPSNSDPQKRIRFDGTINLGHVLTFLAFLGTMVVGWSTMDKRVVVLEEARLVQVTVDRRQDEDRADLRRIMREDLKDVSNKIDRLLDRGAPIRPPYKNPN